MELFATPAKRSFKKLSLMSALCCIPTMANMANVAIIAAVVFAPTASAQTKAEKKEATTAENSQRLAKELFKSIESIQSASSLVDANISFCFEHAEDTTPTMQAASNIWRDTNNIPYLLKAIKEMSPKAKTLSKQFFSQHRADLSAKPEHEWAANCGKFTAQLASGSLDLSNALSNEVAMVTKFAKRLGVTKLRKRNIPPVENPSYSYVKSLGIQPHKELIPTAFKCYADTNKAQPLEPAFDVQIREDGRYKSSFGSGSYKAVWSGPLATHAELKIDFDRYGQSITFLGLTLDATKTDYKCYQQGPSNTAALIKHNLTMPKQASYECLSSSGEALPNFELLSDSTYQVNGEQGDYTMKDLEQYSNTRELGFSSGPLASSTASYSASADTGKRQLTFTQVSKFVSSIVPVASSGSSLTMQCAGKGEPTPYPQYGKENAPKPPVGAGGLDGVFYKRNSNDYKERSYYDFYHFTPEGYMRKGEFYNPVDEFDCTRTRPNGTAPCSTYSVSGNDITLVHDSDSSSSLKRDDLKKLNDKKYTFVGTFWGNESDQRGMCGFDGFSCFISYNETSISFYADGTFYDNSRSQTTSSAGFGGVSASGIGTGSSSNSGTYTIENNVLERRYGNGEVSRSFIGVISDNRFQLDGWTLGRKSED